MAATTEKADHDVTVRASAAGGRGPPPPLVLAESSTEAGRSGVAVARGQGVTGVKASLSEVSGAAGGIFSIILFVEASGHDTRFLLVKSAQIIEHTDHFAFANLFIARHHQH